MHFKEILIIQRKSVQILFAKLCISLLEFGIEKDDDFDDLSYLCQQMKFLEDSRIKTFDPRRYRTVLDEFKLILDK